MKAMKKITIKTPKVTPTSKNVKISAYVKKPRKIVIAGKRDY